MAAHQEEDMEDAAGIDALAGALANVRVASPEVPVAPSLPWWLSDLDKRVSSPIWHCECSGICQRGILSGHALCSQARRDADSVKPENVLASFDQLGLDCLAAALASIIVEHVIALSAADPNANNNDNGDAQAQHEQERDLRDRIPSRYSFDRWRTLEAYLRDHVDEARGSTVGLTLLVRLLEADSDWLLYQTLSSLWRASYGDRDVTSVGLRLAHCGVQRPLVRLLEHRNVTIVLSAVGVIVSVLHGLDEQYQMSFISEGICVPLKQLIVHPRISNSTARDRDMVVTKAINLLGWLACGGRPCQHALVDAGMLEALIPLLSPSPSRDEGDEVVRSSWMAVNWLIYVDEGKQRFLKGGGLALLLSALQRAPLCSGVVFATRKLAMHVPSQRALLEAEVLPLLVKRARELGAQEDRMRYVITLALSFLVLDPSDNVLKELVEASGAKASIAECITSIAIDQNLNVLYTSLQDQRQLLVNASVTAQLFGLWWTLHLLVAETAGHYKRKDYARMLLDEGLLPRVLALLHSSDVRVAKTACFILESLAKTAHVRLRVIEAGALSHLLVLAQSSSFRFMSASDPKSALDLDLHRLRSSVASASALLVAYAPDLDLEVPRPCVLSLRSSCELFALRAVDEDSVTALTDLAYALHLPRLRARCLSFLVSLPSNAAVTFPSASSSTKVIHLDLEWLKTCKLPEGHKGEGTPMH